jgi:hypothetical protein
LSRFWVHSTAEAGMLALKQLKIIEVGLMRRCFVVVFLIILCAGADASAQTAAAAAPTCADLHLVPAPRECTAVQAIPIGGIGFFVTSEKNSEDQFAVEDLIETSLGKRTVREDAPFIRLERAESAPAQALLAQYHLTFDSAMHDEGYIIVPDGQGGLAVIAETSAGIFYGAQTVKQLIRGSGQDSVLLAATLRDWPAMAHRGLSDDWSRGPTPSMEFLKREIRTLAAYKVNIFSPYFEHTFAYASSPVAAFPGGAMTPDEARELAAYATQYHITVIPEQESEVRAVLRTGRDGARLSAGAWGPRHAAADRRLVQRAGRGVSRPLRARRRRRNLRAGTRQDARAGGAARAGRGLHRLSQADSHDSGAQP